MGLSAWRQGWFTPTEHIFLVLDNGTQGVQVGTLVKLKGFKIGEVDELSLESDLNVRVRMRINANKMLLLGSDAKVKLSRDTPISAKYMEFVPGDRPKGTLNANATVALHTGGDVEDILLIAKDGVGKLSAALDKVEPILDDVKKLTSEAANMRETIHGSVNVVMGNLETVSGQVKQIGQTAQSMAISIDQDRTVIVGEIKEVVKTLHTTIAKDVPQMSSKVHQALDDIQKITAQAATDIPPTLRSTRIVTEDVAEITDGAKKTWPVSSFVAGDAPSKPLPLDAFEAKR